MNNFDFLLLLPQICAVTVIVFIAMLVDLISGLHKAKIRGEVHSSWGLKRSVSKFILYEGAILIAGCIDTLLCNSRLLSAIGIELLQGVAMFSYLIGILLCIVEMWSLKERAEDKTQKDLNRAADLLTSMVNKKQLTDAISKAISEAMNCKKE